VPKSVARWGFIFLSGEFSRYLFNGKVHLTQSQDICEGGMANKKTKLFPANQEVMPVGRQKGFGLAGKNF